MFKNLLLNRASKEPLYKQLKNYILSLIWNKDLNAGDLLPTEQQIADSLEISVATVRQSMSELAIEGYIDRKRNRGTMVLNKNINLGYSDSITNFNERVKSMGMMPKTALVHLSIEKATSELARKLEISANEQIIHLTRLRKINDIPIVYIDSFLPYKENQYLLSCDFETESLYQLLIDHPSNPLTHVSRKVSASFATSSISNLLGVDSNTPMLLVETLAYNELDTIMEYSLSFSPTDKNQYSFTVYR